MNSLTCLMRRYIVIRLLYGNVSKFLCERFFNVYFIIIIKLYFCRRMTFVPVVFLVCRIWGTIRFILGQYAPVYANSAASVWIVPLQVNDN